MFKTLYRLVVMTGTLVVAAMALVVYGPQAEKLKPVYDRLCEVVGQFAEPGEQDEKLVAVEDGEPAAFSASSDQPLMPIDEIAQPHDPVLKPAANWEMTPTDNPPQAPNAPNLAAAAVKAPDVPSDAMSTILAELGELGVTDYSMAPWGSSGRLYRFKCSANWGSGDGFSRHFEAVSSDPAEAARQVLGEISQWRVAQSPRASTQIR